MAARARAQKRRPGFANGISGPPFWDGNPSRLLTLRYLLTSGRSPGDRVARYTVAALPSGCGRLVVLEVGRLLELVLGPRHLQFDVVRIIGPAGGGADIAAAG